MMLFWNALRVVWIARWGRARADLLAQITVTTFFAFGATASSAPVGNVDDPEALHRSEMSQLSILDPKFNAKCDGRTDDSAAILAALSYAITNGYGLHFPHATCSMAATAFVMATASVYLYFDNTTLNLTASFSVSKRVSMTQSGTSLAGLGSVEGIAIGQTVSGNGIQPGAVVQAISGATITLSLPATVTAKDVGVTFGQAAITISPKAANLPVKIYGDLTITSTAASAAPSGFMVSFPSGVSSWDYPTFDWYGKLQCLSNTAQVSSPFPHSFANCLTLAHVWQGVIYGLQHTGAVQASERPVAGTSALRIAGDGVAAVGLGVYNLVDYYSAAAIEADGYTEGVYVVEPQIVGDGWGIRVGSATVDGSGKYSGSSGIVAVGGLYANQLRVIGGEINTFAGGVFADKTLNLITKGTHFFNKASDGSNAWRGVIVVDGAQGDIDGIFNGIAVGTTGEAGVLIVNNAGEATQNRVRGIVTGVATGVALGSGTSSNDVSITVGAKTATPVSNSGTDNLISITSDLTVGPQVDIGAGGYRIIGTFGEVARFGGARGGLKINGTSNPTQALDLVGNVTASGAYYSGTTPGVSCSGPPTVSFEVKNGLITHC